ncbi:MAG TPA: hypothetical protein VE956_12745 [Nodularia sp. (in: cyanobacteria)]|nr:hypothetical protein [Nodularia sp. (in: cyanobacteria)]
MDATSLKGFLQTYASCFKQNIQLAKRAIARSHRNLGMIVAYFPQ